MVELKRNKHGDFMKEIKRPNIFHQKAFRRKKRNWITCITNQDGIQINHEDNIHKVFTYYFKDIFSYSNTMNTYEIIHTIKDIVTPDMKSIIEKRFITEEVRTTVSQMNGLVVPGPDGLSTMFYHKF